MTADRHPSLLDSVAAQSNTGTLAIIRSPAMPVMTGTSGRRDCGRRRVRGWSQAVNPSATLGYEPRRVDEQAIVPMQQGPLWFRVRPDDSNPR